MRYMVLVKATAESESGEMPESPEVFEEMNRFNEGSSRPACSCRARDCTRARRAPGCASVARSGPSPTARSPRPRELIAGFWILDVKSKEEAIEWVRRAPMRDGDELEIRRVYEAEDFGDALPEHIKEFEAEIRAKAEAKRS